jgi:hypothetical protein
LLQNHRFLFSYVAEFADEVTKNVREIHFLTLQMTQTSEIENETLHPNG